MLNDRLKFGVLNFSQNRNLRALRIDLTATVAGVDEGKWVKRSGKGQGTSSRNLLRIDPGCQSSRQNRMGRMEFTLAKPILGIPVVRFTAMHNTVEECGGSIGTVGYQIMSIIVVVMIQESGGTHEGSRVTAQGHFSDKSIDPLGNRSSIENPRARPGSQFRRLSSTELLPEFGENRVTGSLSHEMDWVRIGCPERQKSSIAVTEYCSKIDG